MATTDRYSFEDKIDEINKEIAKRRRRWQLSAIAYMDYDDVSQILRAHIYNKWDQWDQNRPLAQWINKIITNRMCNLVRDNYGNVAPPCNGCVFNLGEDHCDFTKSGTKCSECPLYKDWAKKKRNGYNLKLAQSLDSEYICEQPDRSGQSHFIDYDKAASRLHDAVKERLPENQRQIYQMLIVEGVDEREVAKRLNLKSSEKGRKPGYQYLYTLKRDFYKLAQELLDKHDIIL